MTLLTAGVFLLLDSWAIQGPTHVPPTPAVILENETITGDINFTLRVIDVWGADAPSIKDVNYLLLDDRKSAVPGVQGNLTDILNLDQNHNCTSITFYDNDHDEYLTAGDTFWIKNAAYGGEANGNYALLLKYKLMRDKMNGYGTQIG